MGTLKVITWASKQRMLFHKVNSEHGSKMQKHQTSSTSLGPPSWCFISRMQRIYVFGDTQMTDANFLGSLS